MIWYCFYLIWKYLALTNIFNHYHFIGVYHPKELTIFVTNFFFYLSSCLCNSHSCLRAQILFLIEFIMSLKFIEIFFYPKMFHFLFIWEYFQMLFFHFEFVFCHHFWFLIIKLFVDPNFFALYFENPKYFKDSWVIHLLTIAHLNLFQDLLFD